MVDKNNKTIKVVLLFGDIMNTLKFLLSVLLLLTSSLVYADGSGMGGSFGELILFVFLIWLFFGLFAIIALVVALFDYIQSKRNPPIIYNLKITKGFASFISLIIVLAMFLSHMFTSFFLPSFLFRLLKFNSMLDEIFLLISMAFWIFACVFTIARLNKHVIKNNKKKTKV